VIQSASQIQPPHLTLVTDISQLSGETFFEVVEQALSGGVDAVLVREKALTSAKLLALASRLRSMTTAFQARLIIHSQADIAAAVDADGVHLASSDMDSIASVRAWLVASDMMGMNKTVSVSCHNAEELQMAQSLGADYAMLSPVFPTTSHPGSAHLGVDVFDTLRAGIEMPVIALGGISQDNCMLLQGRSLAVISGILAADNPRHAATQLCVAARGIEQ